MTLLKRLADDDNSIDNTAHLLRQLYEVIEAGGASYVQGTIRVIVDNAHAHTLERAAKEAGFTASVRNQ